MEMVRRIVGLTFFILSAAVVIFVIFLKNSFFGKLQRINIAVFSEEEKQAAIFSFSDKEVEIFLLPAKEKVTVVRGFGEYELGNVFPLGEIEGKGGQLLSETISDSLRVPIFGYISVSRGDFEVKSLLWQTLLKKNKTNLSFGNLTILLFKSNNARQFKKINYIKKKELFTDRQVRGESLAVEVFNGTERDGLALRAAEIWENIGGRVVRIAGSKEDLGEYCKLIFGSSVKNSYSRWLLAEIFPCSQEEAAGEKGRADISLIVGKGYWKMLTEKW